MRTSAPSAFTSNKLLEEPGTRSMSPKEQKITSGRAAIATALSISSIGVTQTGQPGPWTSVISRGSKSSRPLLTMVWVWPPQISMIVQGRVTRLRMAWASCSAAFWSRYSLRNFTEFLFQRAQFREILEDALRFGFVNDADGETHVDEDVFADFGFGSIGQVDFLADAAEVDFADAEGDVAAVGDFNYAAWNSETHVYFLPRALQRRARARLKPRPFKTSPASKCGPGRIRPGRGRTNASAPTCFGGAPSQPAPARCRRRWAGPDGVCGPCVRALPAPPRSAPSNNDSETLRR